ncbi:response regulator [Paenibacillus oleatilyticus]|uniref:response regulator n=1 Tax=Paenibacillus oleatilyticus TaxID=2594886 RepID=UPI001C1FD5F9|nr:response regulator [Paenibacillus oleatilyticus]MBU7320096.1 response regulator [Paenibacillus oleatilyticus]
MKAIIVDDEKHVREAIKLLVRWSDFGIDQVLEAQDGLDAVRQIEEHRPQLIFTDMMMPVKSGMELMEWLQGQYPSGKTIVISGHDEFELVRHAVQYGGVDYILKPIDHEQLAAAVEKAVSSIRREESDRRLQQARNIEMNQLKPVYWDKILSNLLTEPKLYFQHAKALDAEFGLGPSVKECRIAILSLDTMSLSFKDKFMADYELLFFSLTNICNELLSARASGGPRLGIAYRYWNSDTEAILLLYGGLDQTQALLERIREGIRDTVRSCFDTGVSRVHPFPEGLTAAYLEARQVLRRRNLLIREKRTLIAGPAAAATSSRQLSFTDYAEPIRLSVQSGSEEQIRRAVAAWFADVRKLDYIDMEQLEHWWHEYNVVRSRWLSELFEGDGLRGEEEHSAPFIVPLDEEGFLSLDRWEQQLVRSLSELSRLLLSHQRQDSNVIFEIAKFIQNHYHQDITLQEIANHFYLSREYISRKFKQEFHVNLSDYISGIRIDKAKLLLLNPNLRISQIAAMVGYDDEKYFSKVFKKTVGVSPNEYRKVNQP